MKFKIELDESDVAYLINALTLQSWELNAKGYKTYAKKLGDTLANIMDQVNYYGNQELFNK